MLNILLAPAASGKTEYCIERVREVQRDDPLAPIRVILPDRNQVSAFRQRIARHGGTFGVEIGTFQDAYQSVLNANGQFVPGASEALVHRLVRRAIESLADAGELKHYAPIAKRSGLGLAITDIIGELKRAIVQPTELSAAVRSDDERLGDLARIYARYQTDLIALGLADSAGTGWLAVRFLAQTSSHVSNLRLLIVDGFDSFNAVTLDFLKLLSARAIESIITLSGERDMARSVYRRFGETLRELEKIGDFEVKTLPPRGKAAPPGQLERWLFEEAVTPIDPEGQVTWLEAQTPRIEAREAMRWLKARIQRDGIGADECAVIARDLGPYRPYLREAAAEFGMGLRFLGGEPLAQNPAVAAILDVLELPRSWGRRALLDVLRSPYLDLSQFGFGTDAAGKFARVAQAGQVIQGYEQWREALARLADAASPPPREEDDTLRELRGDAARALGDALDALRKFITPPSKASTLSYVRWLEERLAQGTGLGVVERIKAARDTLARDASAFAAWRETLAELVLAARITGEEQALDYGTFLGELRSALGTASYDADDPETRRQARIYAGNMNTTRGIPYRAAVILGLSEGIFPAPETEDPFLSDADREGLVAQGLRVEPRLRGMQVTLFYEAVTRAREYLLLTRPYLAADGEPYQPSPYWEATRKLFDAPKPSRVRSDQPPTLSDAASKAELMQAAVRYAELPREFPFLAEDWKVTQENAAVLAKRLADKPEGAHEGDLAGLAEALRARYGDEYRYSPSRLEDYAKCGFYFLIGSVLDLELVEPPTLGLDARQLGILLHSILERTYRTASTPHTLESLVEALYTVAPSILERAPAELGFRPTPYWEYEKKAILEDLADTLKELDGLQGGSTPIALEQRFGGKNAPLVLQTSAGAVRIRGTIDRIDQNGEGELRILDYKTGSTGQDNSSFERGESLQLALYALAAQQLRAGERVTEGFYWSIRGAKASSFKLSKFHHTDEQGREYNGPAGAMAFALEHVGKFVKGIRKGEFFAEAPKDGCPDHCPARNFCWRFEPRRT